jgi:hypothetical protein
MTTDGKSIFRDIAKGLSAEQEREFWEMAAHLEKLSPDDEILRVCQAMGVLTLVTRRIPAELSVEREAWEQACHVFAAQLRLLVQKAEEQSLVLTNRLTGVAQEIETTSLLVLQSAEKVEKALRQGADGFSTEELAMDVRTKMEAAILKPAEETVKRAGEIVQRFETSLPTFGGTVSRLESFNYGSAWGTAFIVCGAVALLSIGFAWLKLDKWYHDSLADEIQLLDSRLDDNEVEVKKLNDFGKQIEIERDPQDGKYVLVMPDADKAWMSDPRLGVIQFTPKR